MAREYRELKSQGKVSRTEDQVKEVQVKYDAQEAPVTAYFLQLSKPIRFIGKTEIVY